MRSDLCLFTTALLAAGAAQAAATPKCNADNCLRALSATQIPGRIESVKAFCASYTAPGAASVTIPAYAADGCKNGDTKARISSACACVAPVTAAASSEPVATPTPTSSSVGSDSGANPSEKDSSSSSSTPAPSSTVHPCAEIRSSSSKQVSANPTTIPVVAASLAKRCLDTVPVDKTQALSLLDDLVPYLEWQSDTAYLKDPPSNYYSAGYDFMANLQSVRDRVNNGDITGQYEFEKTLQESVFFPARDGHFWFMSDFTDAFFFTYPRGVVSYSVDGTSVPTLKLYEDVMSSPDTASTLTTINGVDAVQFVTSLADKNCYDHDIDTGFNTMTFTPAIPKRKGGFGSGGRYSTFYQGDNTTYAFTNGTVATYQNTARIYGNLTGVVDGKSFRKAFCEPASASAGVPVSPVDKADTFDVSALPPPVIGTTDGVVGGYYPPGADVADVAILAIRSFHPDVSAAQFQAAITDFINRAKSDGKTKMVIDLQGNGGGLILLGYELFHQFFPHLQEDGFSRWKAGNAFQEIATVYGEYAADVNPATSSSVAKVRAHQSFLNWRFDLNMTHQSFTSYDEKFLPHVYKDTPYTNLMAWNISDPILTKNSSFGMGIDITGYNSRKDFVQPFAAENIVLLYDGDCSSTCTITSEMFRLQAGVKSVVLGGRPQEGPMQGIGGIKGSQVLGTNNILTYAKRAATYTTDTGIKASLARYADLTGKYRVKASVNTRDQILRDNINDGTPAQFVTENADCRLYWTLPMIKDLREAWAATARSAFGGQKCNWGGIEAPSGDAALGFTPRPGPPPPPTLDTVEAKPDPVTRDPEWLAEYNVKARS